MLWISYKYQYLVLILISQRTNVVVDEWLFVNLNQYPKILYSKTQKLRNSPDVARQSFRILGLVVTHLLNSVWAKVHACTRAHTHTIHTLPHAPRPFYRSVVGPARPPPYSRSGYRSDVVGCRQMSSGVVVKRLAWEVMLSYQSHFAPRRGLV